MNAHCERFNRTIQENFVDYEDDLLYEDLPEFNNRLADWLVEYNTVIPHFGTKPRPREPTNINNLPITPLEYLF